MIQHCFSRDTEPIFEVPIVVARAFSSFTNVGVKLGPTVQTKLRFSTTVKYDPKTGRTVLYKTAVIAPRQIDNELSESNGKKYAVVDKPAGGVQERIVVLEYLLVARIRDDSFRARGGRLSSGLRGLFLSVVRWWWTL